MPDTYKSSKYPIAYVNEEPVYLAMAGWGYEVKLDLSRPQNGSNTPEHKANKPVGRIADFISENPESELNLSREMIFDENSYFDNESALPIDLRISLGRYLIAPVTNQGKFDICEFARKCPPWIANRDLDSIELSVRAQNVYRMQGFEIVRDLGKLHLPRPAYYLSKTLVENRLEIRGKHFFLHYPRDQLA